VPNDRSATLLVHVWLEDDGSFRARLSALPPIPEQGAAPHDVATTASPREVPDAVSAWLDAFLRDHGQGLASGS
jgi:hypothetical protein